MDSALALISCWQSLGCNISLCMARLLETVTQIIPHHMCYVYGVHLWANVNSNRLSSDNLGMTYPQHASQGSLSHQRSLNPRCDLKFKTVEHNYRNHPITVICLVHLNVSPNYCGRGYAIMEWCHNWRRITKLSLEQKKTPEGQE